MADCLSAAAACLQPCVQALHACMRRLQNKLRVFKLLSLKDEYAYLLAADYCSVIDRLLDEKQASCSSSEETMSCVAAARMPLHSKCWPVETAC